MGQAANTVPSTCSFCMLILMEVGYLMKPQRKHFAMLGMILCSVAMVTGCGTGAVQSASSGPGPSSTTKTTTGSTTATSETTPPPTTKQQWSTVPPMQINTSKQYDAVVHTNYGDFTIQLFAKSAPKTVNNFVFLADHHFFTGDTFFRIIKPFMIQTGDPRNNGTGGPGYQFASELPPKYPYAPGIVAMANRGPNTVSNGSQFFICTGSESESLNHQPIYTEFGKIIKGMSVVEKIASIPVKTNPLTGEDSFPTKTAFIESVTIQSK